MGEQTIKSTKGRDNSLGLVLDVSGGDGDTTSLLLGCLVNHVVVHNLSVSRSLGENLGDSSGKSGLSVTEQSCERK